MGNRIGALIAALLILVFLGYYAIDLASVPLAVIIVSVLAMIFVDFVQSIRKGGNQTKD